MSHSNLQFEAWPVVLFPIMYIKIKQFMVLVNFLSLYMDLMLFMYAQTQFALCCIALFKYVCHLSDFGWHHKGSLDGVGARKSELILPGIPSNPLQELLIITHWGWTEFPEYSMVISVSVENGHIAPKATVWIIQMAVDDSYHFLFTLSYLDCKWCFHM